MKKHHSLKTDADSAKGRVLELQAQLHGMSEEMRTQAQLMKALQMNNRKEVEALKKRISETANNAASTSTSASHPQLASETDAKELKLLKLQVKHLKSDLKKAKETRSPAQSAEIKNLRQLVGNYPIY